MTDRFTDRAKKFFRIAQLVALRYNREYVAPEHFLLAFFEEESGGGKEVLSKLGIDPPQFYSAVQRLMETGPVAAAMYTMTGQPNTPATKRILEYAMAEARNFEHTRVDLGHILLGFLHEAKKNGSEGIIGTVFLRFQISIERARAVVRELNVVDVTAPLDSTLLEATDVAVGSAEAKLSEQALIGFCAGVCAVSGLPVHSIPTVYQLMQQPENNHRYTTLVASIRSQLGTIN